MSEFVTRINELIPRLRRYARALTGERGAADDLVQDTLERAWVKLHLWRSGSDLRAWLFTIMHNLYVNQRRVRREELALDEQVLDAPQRATQTDFLEVRDVEAALRRLSDEQREVLLLVALERMSYGEAARTLSIPIGTVMSRLARAREKMRSVLQEDASPAALKVVK